MAPSSSHFKSWETWLWTLLLLATLLALFLIFRFNPAEHSFFPYCPFYRFSGFTCAGCGSLRATHSLLNGQLLEAVQFNALFVFGLPFFIFAAGRMMFHRLFGFQRPSILALRPWIGWAIAALIITFGLGRNISRMLG